MKKQRSFHSSSARISSGSTCSSGGRRRLQFTTALDEVYQEIEILKQLNHPNVIKIHEIIDDLSADKLYLVMPLADYGECIHWCPERRKFRPNQKLLAHSGKGCDPELAEFYDEDQIRKISKSLIYALDYLHSELNIVHRDIKPSNIMLDKNGNPLIVDFGKAKQLKKDQED